MNSFYLRSCVAIACALGLAACGGSGGTLVLAGSVIGLTKDGMTLQNNGGAALAVPVGSTTFVFPDLIGIDASYNITVNNPPGAVCTVFNGSGKSGAINPVNIVVNCITNTYDLGGTVSGLDASGLTLVNGADRQDIPAGATSFSMTKLDPLTGSYASGRVPDGAPYGITVLSQPVGRNCSVANGIGTMGSAPINNVKITCI
ncbi:MAG TPA: hypothetical protein VFG03_19230 [Telluria sp.]|nr:hypothetical protein [Telluria sp.]